MQEKLLRIIAHKHLECERLAAEAAEREAELARVREEASRLLEERRRFLAAAPAERRAWTREAEAARLREAAPIDLVGMVLRLQAENEFLRAQALGVGAQGGPGGGFGGAGGGGFGGGGGGGGGGGMQEW